MNLIHIYFDGGCKPNPGTKYGSYEVVLNQEHSLVKVSARNFGYGTNNEAEFNSLIEALEWTIKSIGTAGLAPGAHTVRLSTDSTIVRNRLMNKSRGKCRRMASLTARCLHILNQFKDWSVEWKGRDANVARFGH